MNIFKEYRKRNGYTQEELALKLHLNQATISKWEKSKSIPDIETLINLADLYKCRVDDLLNRDIIKKEPENIEFKKEYNFTEKQEEILEYVKQLDDYQCKVAKVYFQTLLNDFQESEISQNKSKTE